MHSAFSLPGTAGTLYVTTRKGAEPCDAHPGGSVHFNPAADSATRPAANIIAAQTKKIVLGITFILALLRNNA
jgi:hypothetical protein